MPAIFTGSLAVTGSIIVTQGVTGSLLGTASYATTASYAHNATSANSALTASSADSFTVRGTLTAQTIVVQTITSSISVVTGSMTVSGALNVLGGITGSLLGTASFANNATSASYALTATSASFASNAANAFIQGGNSFGATAVLGTNDTQDLTFETNGSARITINGSSGHVGIGTTLPGSFRLDIIDNTSDIVRARVKNTNATGSVLLVLNPEGAGAGSLGDAAIFYDVNSTAWVAGVDKSDSSKYKIANDPFGDFRASNYFTITTGGSVGIGTISPTTNLHIVGDTYITDELGVGVAIASKRTNYGAEFRANGASAQIFFGRDGGSGGSGAIGADVSNALNVYNSSSFTQIMVVTQEGNVGVGIIPPTDKLHVEGGRISVTSGGTYGLSLVASGSGGRGGIIQTKAASDWNNAMYINSNGSVGVGAEASAPQNALEVRRDQNSYTRALINNNNAGGGTGLSLMRGAGTYAFFEYDNTADTLKIQNQNNGNYGPILLNSAGGNVGVGTTTATAKLHINYGGDDAAGFRLQGDSNDNTLEFRVNNNIAHIQAYTASAYTTGSSLAINASGGNVGIGTSTPDAPLNIYGTTERAYLNVNAIAGFAGIGSGSGAMVYFNNRGDGNSVLIRTANSARTDAAILAVWNDNNSRFIILNNGNVGVGTTTPNVKLQVAGTINSYATSTDGVILASQAASSGGLTSIQLHSNGITYFNGGSVGIGTTAPLTRLDVKGDILINATSTDVGGSVTGSRIMSGVNGGVILSSIDSISAVSFVYYGDRRGTNNTGSVYMLAMGGYYKATIGIVGTNNSTDDAQITFNTVAFNATVTERMRISYTGNVGIGTNNPSLAHLQIQGNVSASSYTGSLFGTASFATSASFAPLSSNAFVQGGNSFGAQALLGTNDVQNLAFETSGSVRMIVGGSSGNVGIGTLTPNYTLQIGQNTGGNNTDYNLLIARHGDSSVAGTYTTSSAITIVDFSANTGPSTVDTTGMISLQMGRFSHTGTNIANATLFHISYDGSLGPFRIDGRGNTWVGYNRTTAPTSSATFSLLAYGGITAGSNYQSTTPPSNGMIVEGSVGIGSTTPTSGMKLDIIGKIRATDDLVMAQANPAISFDNGSAGALRFFSVSASAELMRVTSTGNVGIGSISPTHRLVVAGTAGSAGSGILMSTNDQGLFVRQNDGTTIQRLTYLGSDNVSRFILGPSGFRFRKSDDLTEIFSIDTNGNVGINTTSPNSYLDVVDSDGGQQMVRVRNFTVASTGNFTGQYMVELRSAWTAGASSGSLLVHSQEADDTRKVMAVSDSNGVFTTFVNGKVGIGTTTPSAKLHIQSSTDPGIFLGTPSTPTSGNSIIFARQSGDVTTTDSQLSIYSKYNSFGSYEAAHFRARGYKFQKHDGANYLVINDSGNIGINITSPSEKLEISGSIFINSENAGFIVDAGGNRRVGFMKYPGREGGLWRTGSEGITQDFEIGRVLSGTLISASSVTVDLYIAGDGNVGIGTTSPTVKLHVDGTGTQYIRVSSSDNATFQQIGAQSGGTFVEYKTLYRFVDTDAGERMRITSGGNVGIGSTTPATKLDISGNARITNSSGSGNFLRIKSTTGNYGGQVDFYEQDILSHAIISTGANNTFYIRDEYNAATRLLITNVGNVGIGTTVVNYKLRVEGTSYFTGQIYTGDRINIGNTDIGVAAITYDSSNAYLYASSSRGLWLSTNASLNNGIYINTSGNVGIGTTAPATKLDVRSQIQVKGDTNEQLILDFTAAAGNYTHQSFRVNGTNKYRIIGYVDGDFALYSDTGSAYILYAKRDGNVGIGNTSPDYKLRVEGTFYTSGSNILASANNTVIKNYSNYPWFEGNSASAQIFFGRSGENPWGIGSDGTYAFRLWDKDFATSYLNILTNGNVGIGSTSPIQKLDVIGKIRATDDLVLASTNPVIEYDGGSTGALRFYSLSTTTERMRITSAGNVGIGSTSPAAILDVSGSSVDFVVPATSALATAIPFTINSVGTARSMTGNAGGYSFGDNTMLSLIAGDDVQTQLALWRASDSALGSSAGSRLAGFGSRGTMTLPVSVGDDDVIFSLEGWAIHGAGPNKAKFGAGMRFVKDDDFGTASTYAPQRTEFYNAVNTTTVQTNMTILPNGNVGIGRTSPSYKLDVSGSTRTFGYLLGVDDSTNIKYVFTNDGGASYINSGNVGIGTTAPSYLLHVAGTSYFTSTMGINGEGNGLTVDTGYGNNGRVGLMKYGGYEGMLTAGNSTILRLGHRTDSDNVASGGTPTIRVDMHIAANGSIGISTTSPSYALDVTGTIRATGDIIAYSDARVKTNVVTVENALEKVKLLRGVNYTRKDDITNTQKVGVIAQEVLPILPEVVQQDDSGNYSVAYGNMVGILIEAIKEQQRQIDDLKYLLQTQTK
jgi:fibronectin-binding autotransporter adhesin